jgi:phosphatidylserine/phosphatidylglycerophosphate/cardiolipin synthase-like enzyme
MLRQLAYSTLVALSALTAVACAAPAPEDDSAAAEGALSEDAQLPECASPLMRSIFERAVKDVKKGTVPASLFASSNNSANLTPLVTGPQIFPAMARLIEGAQHEVDMQFYVFKTDCDPAKEIFASLKKLEERRRADGATTPVKVRLLFSALSLIGVKTKVAADTMKAVDALSLDPAFVTFELAMYTHGGLGNLHSKTLMVDGREAIVTGANVQKQHDYVSPWHDTAYHLSGDVARSLLAEFDHAWKKGAEWTCGTNEHDFDSCTRHTKTPDHADLPGPGISNACVPMLVTGRPGDGFPFANGIDNTQDQAFLATVANAKSVLRIHTPNLNDDALKKALVAAILATPELTIDIVMSKGFNDSAENLPTLGGTNEETARDLYKRLSNEGVANACERLRIRWYSHDGVSAVDGNVETASHTKYMSADGQVAIVGSANMDNIAWNHSREVNVVVDSREITQAWDKAMFEPSFTRAIAACP